MVIETPKGEITNPKETIKFENPELEEMKKEATLKTREIVDKLAKFKGDVFKVEMEEGANTNNIEKMREYLNLVDDVLGVIYDYETKKKENPEFIEKQKMLAIETLNKINAQQEENKRFNEYVSKLNLNLLNNLKGRELEQLNKILLKISDNKLLDSKELFLLKDFSERKFEEDKDKKGQKLEEGEKLGEKENVANLEQENDIDQQKNRTEKGEEIGDQELLENQQESIKDQQVQKKSEQSLENLKKDVKEENLDQKEDLEKKVLSIEEAEKQLLLAKEEYLKKYREAQQKELALKKEKDPKKRDILNEELNKAKLYLDNAERIYKKALDEYKVAYYFNEQNKKKKYLFNELLKNKGDILREKLKKQNPNLTEKELNDLVLKHINEEVENEFKKEKKEIDKAIIGALAYNILDKEETLNNEKLEILAQEKEKVSGFISKIWDKYKNLSFSKRVVVGSIIAGITAGGLGVLGGAGFAALGIGAVNALRRLVTGFVVGGSIKGLSEIGIRNKEREKLTSLKEKRVSEIQEEIVNLLNNTEKELKKYEDYLKVMQAMDNRIDETLKEAEAIRNKSNKSRKKWTLIAVGAGGLVANADNIYNLFKGFFGSEDQLASETLTGGSGKEGGESIIPEKQPPANELPGGQEGGGETITPEKPSLNETLPGEVENAKGFVKIGKGGFWEAALKLKEQYGLSNEEFSQYWANSVVENPLDKKLYPMSEAHFIRALTENQNIGLTFDPEKKIFKAVLGEKVEVGGAEKLLESYYKLNKSVPEFVKKSIEKGINPILRGKL